MTNKQKAALKTAAIIIGVPVTLGVISWLSVTFWWFLVLVLVAVFGAIIWLISSHLYEGFLNDYDK